MAIADVGDILMNSAFIIAMDKKMSHEGIVSEAEMGESLRIGQRSSWKPGQLGESKISVIFLAANLKLIGPFHGTLELGREKETNKKLRGPLIEGLYARSVSYFWQQTSN